MPAILERVTGATSALSTFEPPEVSISDTVRQLIVDRLYSTATINWLRLTERISPDGTLDFRTADTARKFVALEAEWKRKIRVALDEAIRLDDSHVYLRTNILTLEKEWRPLIPLPTDNGNLRLIDSVLTPLLAPYFSVTFGKVNRSFMPDPGTPMFVIADALLNVFSDRVPVSALRRVSDTDALRRSLDQVVKDFPAAYRYELQRSIKRLRKVAAPPPAPRVKTKTLTERLVERFEAAKLNQVPSESLDAFVAFPILGRRAVNARSSRTWGVEIEIATGGSLTPPSDLPPDPERYRYNAQNPYRGWTRHADSSVSGDGSEWVSPILKHTYDAGLKHMLDQAKSHARHPSASMHVHVDVKDRDGVSMNSTHVSRLLEAYAMLSPIIAPVTQRDDDRMQRWCRPIDPHLLAEGWFKRDYPEKQKAGQPKRGRSGVRTDPVDNARIAEWQRYTAINLQSLSVHGTIEFRALGPVYSYEYVTRWAWMLRELCNYATTTLPLSAFAKCRHIGDVLAVLEPTAREKLNPTTAPSLNER